MAEQAAKEPTMEEILASIRRIISEGGEPEADMGAAAVTASELTETTDDGSLDEAFDVSDLLSDQDNEAAPSEEEHLLSVDELLGSNDLEFGDADDASSIEADDISVPSLEQDVSAGAQPGLSDAFDNEMNEINDLDSLLGEVDAIEAASEASVPAYTPEPTPMPQPAPTPAPVTPPTAAPSAATAAAALSGNSTLEGLVSELMKPIIQEWIETNLPNIVERRVEAEINQIAAKVISALRD